MSKWPAITLISAGLMIAHSSAQRPATGRISGHVVDSVGATISGASIFVHKHLSEDNVKLVAHTDGNGDFMLALPEGGYDVLVTSPAFVAEVETIGVVSGRTRKTQWKIKVVGCNFPGMNCDTFQ